MSVPRPPSCPPAPPPAARALRRAFTLVELLVVIGIIALLISILLPALNRARAQAQQVACLNNLRSLAQAGMVHASEHQNFFPAAGFIWTAGGATPAGAGDDAQIHYDYYQEGTTTRLLPLPGALAAQLGAEVRLDSKANVEADLALTGTIRKMFTCPAEDPSFIHHGSTVVDGGWTGPLCYTSYAFNEAALGYADDGNGGVSGHSRARANLARIPHSATVMFMGDGLPRTEFGDILMDFFDHGNNVTLAEAYLSDQNGMNAGTKSIFDKSRHGGKMNVSFMDGHAETVVINANDLQRVSLNNDFP